MLGKHGIDFWRATEIREKDHIILPARSDDEIRHKAVGMLDGALIVVVVTWRGDRLRLITARRAREDEKRAYRAVYG